MNIEINEIIDSFQATTLGEMDSVMLMDRYDTKFLLHVNHVPQLLSVMADDYNVLKIRESRVSEYKTNYLDTPDFLFYYQHVTDRKNRLKVRVREYMPAGNAFLEIKKKNRKRKTMKWRIEHEFSSSPNDKTSLDFINKHVPFESSILEPSISSSFKRITFVRFDTPERITLDMDLAFTGVNGKRREFPYLAIAELKSDGIAVRSPFFGICRGLSLFPVGFSKYCTGVALLHDLPKKNLMKEKILLINRIENEFHGSLIA